MATTTGNNFLLLFILLGALIDWLQENYQCPNLLQLAHKVNSFKRKVGKELAVRHLLIRFYVSGPACWV
tara:strand:+ start:914 stop:1120 length:207 start_codon:yes stop_codon:yes gene_type:complete